MPLLLALMPKIAHPILAAGDGSLVMAAMKKKEKAASKSKVLAPAASAGKAAARRVPMLPPAPSLLRNRVSSHARRMMLMPMSGMSDKRLHALGVQNGITSTPAPALNTVRHIVNDAAMHLLRTAVLYARHVKRQTVVTSDIEKAWNNATPAINKLYLHEAPKMRDMVGERAAIKAAKLHAKKRRSRAEPAVEA
jgi:purine nucleoside permease